MDVSFVIVGRDLSPFILEVGYFDTVLEIKGKLEYYRGIPAWQQALFYNDEILDDDWTAAECGIIQNCWIQIILCTEKADLDSDLENEFPQAECSYARDKYTLDVVLPELEEPIQLEMCANDSVLELRQKIQELLINVPSDGFVIRSETGELPEHCSLSTCELEDHTKVKVELTAPSTDPKKGDGEADE